MPCIGSSYQRPLILQWTNKFHVLGSTYQSLLTPDRSTNDMTTNELMRSQDICSSIGESRSQGALIDQQMSC